MVSINDGWGRKELYAIRWDMQTKWGYARDAGKILVKTEETRLTIDGDRGNQRIDRCKTNALRPRGSFRSLFTRTVP
jgi:hypothetical protein